MVTRPGEKGSREVVCEPCGEAGRALQNGGGARAKALGQGTARL